MLTPAWKHFQKRTRVLGNKNEHQETWNISRIWVPPQRNHGTFLPRFNIHHLKGPSRLLGCLLSAQIFDYYSDVPGYCMKVNLIGRQLTTLSETMLVSGSTAAKIKSLGRNLLVVFCWLPVESQVATGLQVLPIAFLSLGRKGCVFVKSVGEGRPGKIDSLIKGPTVRSIYKGVEILQNPPCGIKGTTKDRSTKMPWFFQLWLVDTTLFLDVDVREVQLCKFVLGKSDVTASGLILVDERSTIHPVFIGVC